MDIAVITKDNFDAEVAKCEKLVMVDFWASWCGPCRMLSPVVDEIAGERDDLKVGKVNVDEQEEITRKFGIMNIPTLLFFKNGELVNTSVGLKQKSEIISMIEKLK